MTAEMGEKRLPEKEGVYFLVYKEGKILIEERITSGKAYYGYNIVPGGKVNFVDGESHEQGAKREIKEELGVEATKLVCLDRFLNTSISNHLYDISVYLILDFKGEVTNVENKSIHRWVDIEKANEFLPFGDSRYVVLLAREYLSRQNE